MKSLVLCLLFALAAKAWEDTTYDRQDFQSIKDVKKHEDGSMAKSEDDKASQQDASIAKRLQPLVVPVAHYPLNSAYGAQEKDGKQPSGVIHGSVTPAPGPHNESDGAYEFPGTSDSYIEFPNDGGLDTRFSITLMCWVQPGGQDGPLFNYRESGPWGVHIWINFKKFFNRITVRDTHAFRTAISSFEELAEGQWYHVAATYDHNTGVNSLFINGDPDHFLFIDTDYQISTNDNKVRMGVKAGDGRYFKGKITQMKVYDVALNADQIQAAMNAEVPDPCSSLPCDNGGTCINLGYNAFECECAHGFGGEVCDEDLDPCLRNPCHNGGTCIDLGDYVFECKCAKGYTGQRCKEDVDECEHHNGGCQDICVNTIGSYYCECSDPEFSVAPDKSHCIAEGVDLYCGQDEMTITLPKSLLKGLDVDHLRLIDEDCTATENVTHFFLTTKTTECGTLLKHNNDHAIYSNMVSEIPLEEHQIVTRVREAMIPFHCFYSKWGVVSSIGIKPASKKVILSSKGFGEFTITLDVFRNSYYIVPYTQDDYPIQFYIRERVYLETCVDTEDDRLTILALECYATPSQDRDSQPRYDVIRDGCSVDDTLKFHPSPSDQCQRLSLEAFQYVNKHPYVFFHCKVMICNASDPDSRCAQGCLSRGRRSVKPLPESADDIYALAQGPLTLNREKREAEADEADQSVRVASKGMNFSVVAALAVVIGACAVGMGYMAWQKKKETSARQFIPLYEDLQN